MSSNRLLPYQFAPGLDASPTRIEQSLLKIAELYDDVPPEFVQRRWSPSHMLWGFSPPSVQPAGTPYLDYYNAGTNTEQPVSGSQITNPYRCKSCYVEGLGAPPDEGYLLTWEVTVLASHPMIISSLVVMAGLINGATSTYTNPWLYGADPPPGKGIGTPTEDFSLQVCISDGWDLENRKKLRQESLIYQTPSKAFKFSPAGIPAALFSADTTLPPMPLEGGSGEPTKWNGFAVMADALVLVPVGARMIFQWTIPWYGTANRSTWGHDPELHNTWNLRALAYSPTH